MSVCGAQRPVFGAGVFIGSGNICLELGRLWAGGNSAAFEVDCCIKRGSGAVV